MSILLSFDTLFFTVDRYLSQLELIMMPIASTFYWIKIRLSYSVKSWIYTTNHKRIAINYFSFIFVSGTAGMGLATVIRLEFAYPGVGVFAGDSLQYLSIATAHGVIMVFFMIMPTLFGAFGNFLLPTQLGVHDVAFPRLNSAAFWFLPGGLIMLAQLVCIDRRYQRMNCFNIRELQSMLKKRFFTDLVNSNDHHTLLNNSMIGLRYKTNSSNLVNSDITNFYNLGTTNSPKTRNNVFISQYVSTENEFVTKATNLIFPSAEYFVTFSKSLLTGLLNAAYSLPSVLLSINPLSILSSISATFYLPELPLFLPKPSFKSGLINSAAPAGITGTELHYTTYDMDSLSESSLYYSLEISDSVRFTRFFNPIVSYSYKSGHYLGIWDKVFPALITSFIEPSKNIIKASWFFSLEFSEKLNTNYKDFLTYFSSFNSLKPGNFDAWYTNHIQPMYNYFNIFDVLSNDTYINSRWVSLGSLNQKFSRMFTSVSTQQRTLANWRQLKFTREAWRCKLLAARHQNTVYRRFLGEEGLIWSVDRNAKDLLPGWAMITPFSARTRYTAIGKTDIGLMGVAIVLNASIVSSANFLVTYRYLSTLNNRKMRDARSFFAESLIVASWMMIAANPMLVIAIVMLLCDRHWQTSFFDYSGGGDTVLFQHMFWFFGHPEVYIIMIPVFGFANTVLSYYLRKRVSARSSLMYSLYTIAFLGFFVWGHHMYMVGLAHTTRMLFSTLTVMISVPAATKLMHWSVTLVNSYFTMEVPFLWTLTFIYFFISGGVSGMCVAHTGMDVLFHDTFYVIGHFHVMLSGSGMMGIFSAFYFYFPAMYGVKYSRIYAYIHYVYYVIGQFLTVVPMLWLGYCGMPRRVLDYPSTLGGWHAIASAGHLLSVFAMLSFFIMIYDSIRQAKPTIRSNFGVGRFNTRLNFYLFEIGRLSFVQRKSFYSHRLVKNSQSTKTDLSLLNLSYFDSTLFSYKFLKKR